MKAYVFILVKPGSKAEVKEAIPGEVHELYGEYDLIAELNVKDLEELREIITRIRKNINVLKTETLIAMR